MSFLRMEIIMSSHSLEHLVGRIHPQDRIIKASAGTGKTTFLTQLTLDTAKQQLQETGKLPRMIVTTFTRKATEELKERISRKILAEEPQLIGLVQSAHYLHISTIHGVLSAFLKRYGHLCGLESGFQIVDKDATAEFLTTLLHQFFSLEEHRQRHSELLSEFTFEQLIQAIDCLYEVMITAPDSRFASDIDQKSAMVRSLKKSGAEAKGLLDDVGQFVDCSEDWVVYGNSLSKFLKIIESAQPDFIDFDHLEKDLSEVQTLRPRYSKKLPFDSEQNTAQRESVSALKEQLDKLKEWQQLLPTYKKWNQSFHSIASLLVPQIVQEKKSRGILDSRDLELFSLMALRSEPELAKAFSSDFDFWMIDEFQDTSPLQIQLVDMLRGEAPAQYVGDPQQSIYLFRGARVEVFDKVHAAISKQNGPQKQLLKNYRSKPELLACINDLLEQMGPAFSLMESYGEVEKPENRVAEFCLEPAEDQARYASIVSHVQGLIAAGAEFGDICILGRTQLDLARVTDALKKAGIPTTLHIASGFFARREVLDALILLKFLVNPHDDVNLLSLLRSPFFHMTDAELIQLAERPATVWSLLKDKFPEHAITVKLKEMQQRCRSEGVLHTLRASLEETRFFAASLYLDPSYRREANIWKLLQILRESERLPGFSYTGFLRKVELAWLDSAADDADAAPITEANRVNLMTVHKSKGLNFKHVIIPHMEKIPRLSHSRAHESIIAFDEDQKIWSSLVIRAEDQKKIHSPAMSEALKKQDERELKEADRLLYVAITRAQESLFFHAVDAGRGFSQKSWAHHFTHWLTPGVVQKESYQLNCSHGPWSLDAGVKANGKSTPLREVYTGTLATKSVERFSVSSLLQKETEAKPIYSSLNQKKSALYAPGKGMVLHRAFEALKFQDLDSVIQTQMQLSGQDSEFKAAILWTLQLEKPPIQKLIKQGFVEWGFQVMTPKGVLEGQIDLWGVSDEKIWLVDYKSGSLRNSKKAIQQLKLYAYALAKIYKHRIFNLAVVYPYEQKSVVEIETVDPLKFEKQYFSAQETQIELSLSD